MKHKRRQVLFALCIALLMTESRDCLADEPPQLANPIMFVTQLPIPYEWMTISQSFGNHIGKVPNCGRGGDLYIRYTDGELRNLTLEAGYGNSGFQGENSVAVRDPHVHWSGAKAIFSMAIGATEQRYVHRDYFWQLYEVSGFGPGEAVTITRVPNQPETYNNISPVYGSDDRILFTSDRPRNGATHLYPQLDEYESVPTVTGIWSLDPGSGDLFNLNHSPSGNFNPIVDSRGRVISTKWDHLQRDQQNDAGTFGAYNWSSEAENSNPTGSAAEFFPEPRQGSGNLNGHTLESFFPWQMDQDGRNEELLNHLGRHELVNYFNRSFNNDPALKEFLGEGYNPNRITNLFQLREDPNQEGYFYAANSPTFYHHASGQIVGFNAAVNANPDSFLISFRTPEGYNAGHFRHPLPLADGQILASHTWYDGASDNLGSRHFPRSPFKFRLTRLDDSGDQLLPGELLTAGIYKPVTFWDPDEMITYEDSIAFWELSPVEVVGRALPELSSSELEAPELQIFDEENINLEALSNFLVNNELALVVSRNLTTRDHADRQQPFNLRVAGTTTQTLGDDGIVYDIAHLQFFQGDQIRSYEDYSDGRRVLAMPMHDATNWNIPNPEGPQGSVSLGEDGSMAAFVPARRALTWQLTDSEGEGVVRERFWITFQPGEIRVCTSCHGINSTDQAGQQVPLNPPEALRDLMQYYQSVTSISERAVAAAHSHQLIGNYPNPFNPSTVIRYSLFVNGFVSLRIYDVRGRLVKTAINGQEGMGVHEYSWDGINDTGQPVASGVYFYQLSVKSSPGERATSGEFTQVKKMMLLR